MSINDDVGYVTWKQSQLDLVIQELMHDAESKKEGKREQKRIKHRHGCLSPHDIPPWFFHTVDKDALIYVYV
ncbi:hypothetical protein C8R48DRAFT_780705 [Suillus tomentosus]|nr:hypothetical protein C8R48DRAFT_780705 [Suillus tomentosus]